MNSLTSLFLLLAAQGFWQTRAPEEWTRAQARQLTVESPWAARAVATGKMGGAPVPVLLLGALPVCQALDRLERTAQPTALETGDPEYRVMLKEKPGAYIMLGVTLPDPDAIEDAREASEVERSSVLRIGKRKYKPVAVMPPGERVPYLVLVFPRQIEAQDKAIRFELYIPAHGNPYREVEFRLADLVYRGAPEF